MARQKHEEILDKYIKELRHGESVDRILERQPKNSTLADNLKTASLLTSLRTKPANADSKTVWSKIQAGIKENLTQEATAHVFHLFRFALSRATVAIVTILVAVGLVNATAVTAQSSVPGETLYPIKKTVERIQLAFTVDETKKTEVRLKHAETRLIEVQVVAQQTEEGQQNNETKTAVVKAAIGELAETTEKIGQGPEVKNNKELLEKVVEFADKQSLALTDIAESVPEAAEEAAKAKDKAATAKSEAQESLARLSSESKTNNGSENSSTTTNDILTSPTSTSEQVRGTSTPTTLPKTSSSTDEKVKKYGETDNGTSTELFIPEARFETQTGGTETTTIDVIILK